MACQAFSSDSFAPLTGDPSLPIIMHHGSTSDCLPATSHAPSMVAAGKVKTFHYFTKLVKQIFLFVLQTRKAEIFVSY